MLRFKLVIVSTLIAAVQIIVPVENAEAGPLLDWFRGLRNKRQCAAMQKNCDTCATPTTTAYSNPCGLQPGQCQTTCMKTCSRTVVNYVPYTAYRTQWERCPVTQYRPVTTRDPCTGCTVTCMRPCTTYTYQMKRIPYTTYRPCYRTESYRVPVTTITNDCNPCGTSNACSTCNVAPTTAAPQTVTQPTMDNSYYTYPNGSVTAPSGTLNTEGGFSTEPANNPPALDANPTSTQRPIYEQLNSTFTRQTNWPRTENPVTPAPPMPSTPAVINLDDKVARGTVRQRWSYSPVRLASYTRDVEQPESWSSKVTERKPQSQPVNSGWETVDW